MKVLHRIIAKSGTDQDAIRGFLTEEAAVLAKFDEPVSRGESTSYVQVPRDKFKADTLELVVIDKAQGIMALQGELAESEDSSFVAKFFQPKKSQTQALAIANAEPVAVEVIKAQYCYELYDELDAAWAAIRGVMAQEMGEAKAKISAANAVLDNLRAYINEAVFLTKGQALVKQETEQSPGEPVEPAKTDGEDAQAPADGEAGGVSDTATSGGEVAKTENALVQSIDMTSVVKSAVEEAMKPLQDQIKTLTDEKTKMAEKIASLEATPAGTVRTAGDVDAPESKSTTKSQKSVFDGLIFDYRS